jgi:hypothetical protein
MLDLRFNNIANKNKNSKYEKGDKYVKFQRLYKRYEKEIEGKYKKDIPQFRKLKKMNEEYKLFKKNKNEGRFRLFSKSELSESSKKELEILMKKMTYLDAYFELKRDLAELFSRVTETLNTKSFPNNEEKDYSSRVENIIGKLNKFKKVKYSIGLQNSNTTTSTSSNVVGGKKKVKKSVKKSVKKVKKTIRK